MTDLERLSQWYRIEITQLEAQLEEVKRKHDILVEASRLVEEEMLKPLQSYIPAALKQVIEFRST